MLRNKAILKEQLTQLSKKELVEMLLKLSGKRFNYEFLLVNFLDTTDGELLLFDEAKDDILTLHAKEYKGRTIQHQAVKRLNACTKRIADFCVEVKNKKLEADLLLFVLQLQFDLPKSTFGARISGYDYKVGLLLKRLITLLRTKIHPDYFIDYQETIQVYLTKLHHTSDRVATIKQLPYTFDFE